MNKRLRKITFLKPSFVAYDWVMETFHLYSLKARLKHKFFINRLKREDATKKRSINRKIFAMQDNLFNSPITPDDIIVSLTSYGKRVVDVLPYALYSLITQTQRPPKIVVYLDWDNWNDDNLPDILKKIKNVGVDFRFCEDLRSYKKLIPALQDFPDNPIVTTDDDFYYNPNFIEGVQSAYSVSDKQTVLGYDGVRPSIMYEKYCPYNEWMSGTISDKNNSISLIGYAGICYPPHIFDGEILKSNIFMKICPAADDIWFWAMEERQNISRAYITPYLKHKYVNRCEEYWENVQNTLMNVNCKEGGNNPQFEAVVNYYGLKPVE